MHLYRLHSSWDAWRQRRSCDDDSSSLSPACSCGFQTRTDLQLEVVGPETHLVCIRGAAEAVAADASGLPKRNQVGETHLCDGQAPLRQTWAPLRLPNPSCHHAPAPRCPPSSAWASCAAPSAWWVGVGCTEVVSRGSRASGVTLRAPRTRSAPQHAGSPPITTYHHLFVGGYVVGGCGGV